MNLLQKTPNFDFNSMDQELLVQMTKTGGEYTQVERRVAENGFDVH